MNLSSLKVKLAAVALLSVVGTSSAFAHHCTPINKKAGAGSIATINVATGSFTIHRRNAIDWEREKAHGGFITITNGDWSYDVFVHQTLPDGAFAAGPEGDDHCDGRGVDEVMACLAAQ